MDTVAALLPLGRHEEALACQREVMAKGAQAGRWDAVLAARSGLSEVLRLTGRYSEAEFHAELALELAQTVGDVAQEASMHITLGHIRCAYQDFDRALALYREGLALVTDRDEPRCAARCLEAIGDVHAGQGRMQEAREAWHSALTVLNRLKDPDQHGTTSTPMTGPMPGR
jgi:tetratricopeptide (TPR) repeat protein